MDQHACGRIFFGGRWELRRDHTNSYVNFAITPPPNHRLPMVLRTLALSSAPSQLSSASQLVYASSFPCWICFWSGAVRFTLLKCLDHRNIHVMWWKHLSVARHQSEQIRMTTPLSLTAIQKRMEWRIFAVFVKGCVDNAMTAGIASHLCY